MDEKELRKELENAYNNVRQALIKKDYETFIKVIEPAKPKAYVPKEQWPDAVGFLIGMYEDLKKLEFIKVVDKGEYAYMILRTYLDDENYITIDAFKFHKVKGKYILSGKGRGTSFPKDKDAKKMQANINEEVKKLEAKLE